MYGFAERMISSLKKSDYLAHNKIRLFVCWIVVTSIFAYGNAVGALGPEVKMGIMVLVSASWLFCVLVLKLSHRVTFSLAIFCLLLLPIFLAFHKERTAENLALFSYLFILFGCAQLLIER